jgi:peptidoglycan/xylan/chitin deacetylase (PgdA/CDA1 family)
MHFSKIIITIFMISQFVLSQAGEKTIAVTFDDLPLSNATTLSNTEMRTIVERLLTKIQQENIPVTAFVNEDKLEANGSRDPERIAILKLWQDAGVDLGNHTYAHKSENVVSVAEAKEDILKGERTIKELLAVEKKKPKYFRHPFLQTGRDSLTRATITRFLDSLGYIIAPVTIDNSEWIFAAAFNKAFANNDSTMMNTIGNEYIAYMRSKLHFYEWMSDTLFGRQINQILLIHSNRLNSYYFTSLCTMIRGEGYSFISLEASLKDKAYRSRDTFFGGAGISWMDRWALTRGFKGKFFSADPHVPKSIMEFTGVEYE